MTVFVREYGLSVCRYWYLEKGFFSTGVMKGIGCYGIIPALNFTFTVPKGVLSQRIGEWELIKNFEWLDLGLQGVCQAVYICPGNCILR